MKKTSTFPAIVACYLLFAPFAISAEKAKADSPPEKIISTPLKNPKAIMKDIFSTVDFQNSSETPKGFDAQGRRTRLRSVLNTDEKCPRYESFRTGSSPTAVGNKLKLKFNKPIKAGTIIACSDTPGTFFSTSISNNGKSIPVIWKSKSILFATVPENTEFDEIDFTSRALSRDFEKARYINRGLEVEEPKMIFALHGIHFLKGRYANLAEYAKIAAPPAVVRNKSEKDFVSVNGLNDLRSEGFWRGKTSKSGGNLDVLMSWPRTVSVNMIGFYFNWNCCSEMPESVAVFGKDEETRKWRELAKYTAFDNDVYTGKHFAMIAIPRTRLDKLKLVFKARDRKVALTEIFVLGTVEENQELKKSVEAKAHPVDFTIKVPKGTKFSAVIDDYRGNRVRNLVANATTDEFAFDGVDVHIPWDGLNDDGKVVQPGDYKLRGVIHKPLKAIYEMSVYSPPQVSAPWVTGDGRGGWLSDHAAPSTILAMGDEIWVGAPLAEAGSTIMELDLDGRKLWGTRWLDLAGAEFLAYADGAVFAASQGGWRKNQITVARLNPSTKKFKRVVSTSGQVGGRTRKLTGFAISAKTAFLAFASENVIEFWSLETGELLKTAKIAAPAAMAVGKEAFFVVSTGKIVKFDPKTGKTSVFIDVPAMKPANIAVAPDGRLLVCDSKNNQVFIFSAKGALISTIGKAGGRKAGPYDPLVFDRPSAAAVDPKGRVWICESGMQPKRISVWTAEGELLKQYIGTGQYACGGSFDPNDATRYFSEGMEFKLDFKTGKSKLASIYWMDDRSNVFGNGKREILSQMPDRSIRSHGELFLTQDSYWSRPFFWFGVMNEKSKILKPVAAVGNYELILKALGRSPAKDDSKKTFLWSDANENGKVEFAEIATLPGEFFSMSWGCSITDDLAFLWMDRTSYRMMELNPNRWSDSGIPQYEVADAKPLKHSIPERPFPISLMELTPTSFLLNTKPLTCFRRSDGKVLWTYPNPYPSNSHDSPIPKSGDIQHTLRVEGVVPLENGSGAVFSLNSNKGLRHIFTTDGIYVAPVFRDFRLAPSISFVNHPKPGMNLIGYSLEDEAFNGTFQRTSDGIIRMACGKNHNSIFKIEGLDTLARFERSFVMDAKTAKLAAERLTRELRVRENRELRPPIAILRVADRREFEASKRKPAKIAVDGHTVCAASFARNDEFLFFHARIKDSNPFANAGDDFKMLFKTGDSFNMEFGRLRGKGGKSDTEPGDVRIIVAPFEKRPVCVVYRYKVPGTKNPIVFSSPWNETIVDKVEILKNADISVKLTGDGYILVGKIPLKDLGLKIDSTKLAGDFGVIFSDAGGAKNAYALFYNNPAHGITADVPSEIRLRPDLWKKIKK